MIKLTDKEFTEFVEYMHSNYGIDLSKKKVLIEGRLSNLIEKKGFKNFSDYIKDIKLNGKDEITTLVNKLTTNYTYFYREEQHFEYITKIILPNEEINNKTKTLNIWSAGCSSGEEPYTIAMVLDDYFKLKAPQWKINITASDISENVLLKAREGIYEEENIKKLPEHFKKRYFEKIDGDKYKVTKDIRKNIEFKTINLMGNLGMKNKFDVIFCRNVMIYFNTDTKMKLINKFYEANKDDGYLLIGHAETIQRDKSKYNYIKPAIYKKG